MRRRSQGDRSHGVVTTTPTEFPPNADSSLTNRQ